MDTFAPSDVEALVTLGVDTHADVHVGVALDRLGKRLGSKSVPTTEAGYAELVAWAEGFGALDRVGVEGSGSFGAGLARFLRARGVGVVEVNRPNRQHRRRFGKARHGRRRGRCPSGAGQRGHRRTQGRRRPCGDGACPARSTPFGGEGAYPRAANQLRALVLFTAPEELRTELRGLSTNRLVTTGPRVFAPAHSPASWWP
jgi:transposase